MTCHYSYLATFVTAAVYLPTLALRNHHAAPTRYTYVGEILVAVNPFKMIDGLYGHEKLTMYKGFADKAKLPPHVYVESPTLCMPAAHARVRAHESGRLIPRVACCVSPVRMPNSRITTISRIECSHAKLLTLCDDVTR